MKNNNESKQESAKLDTIDVPINGPITVQRQRGYGRIADLELDELADVRELQRMVAWQMYGPILALPGRGGRLTDVALTVDGEVDWQRTPPVAIRWRPGRWSAAEAPSRIRHVAELARPTERQRAASQVLALVRQGVLAVEHVTDADLQRQARREVAAAAYGA